MVWIIQAIPPSCPPFALIALFDGMKERTFSERDYSITFKYLWQGGCVILYETHNSVSDILSRFKKMQTFNSFMPGETKSLSFVDFILNKGYLRKRRTVDENQTKFHLNVLWMFKSVAGSKDFPSKLSWTHILTFCQNASREWVKLSVYAVVHWDFSNVDRTL